MISCCLLEILCAMLHVLHEHRSIMLFFLATHLTIFEKLVPSFKPALSFLWSAGVGADARRPPCRKAKELRKERRLQKEQLRRDADGVTSAVTSNPSTPIHTNQPKHLEDFISESLPNNPSHCLEVSR